MAYKQWRKHGGGGGVKPPHRRFKKKLLFLKRSAFFHTEFAEIAVMFFCAYRSMCRLLIVNLAY